MVMWWGWRIESRSKWYRHTAICLHCIFHWVARKDLVFFRHLPTITIKCYEWCCDWQHSLIDRGAALYSFVEIRFRFTLFGLPAHACCIFTYLDNMQIPVFSLHLLWLSCSSLKSFINKDLRWISNRQQLLIISTRTSKLNLCQFLLISRTIPSIFVD